MTTSKEVPAAVSEAVKQAENWGLDRRGNRFSACGTRRELQRVIEKGGLARTGGTDGVGARRTASKNPRQLI